MDWNSPAIRQLLQAAFQEDSTYHDITTQALIPPALRIQAEIRSNQRGIICGLTLAKAFFQTFDPNLSFQTIIQDGQPVKRGTHLAVIRGRAQSILSAERPALNALQHLSGIATYTHQQVKRLGPGRTKIYDTRKTLPGWRDLQKYAVKCGGGTNHRSSLAGAIMLKDNHLKVARLAKLDWMSAARKLRVKSQLPFEMEIQDERDLRDALCLKPPIVLLDNIPFAKLKAMISVLRKAIPGVLIEISGRVDPRALPKLKHFGADRISMGRLTHSAPIFDCSLDIICVIPSHAR